jgi:hypothetical protein
MDMIKWQFDMSMSEEDSNGKKPKNSAICKIKYLTYDGVNYNLAWENSASGKAHVVFQEFNGDPLGDVESYEGVSWNLVDQEAWADIQSAMLGNPYTQSQVTKVKNNRNSRIREKLFDTGIARFKEDE